jgi:hypothetical protein
VKFVGVSAQDVSYAVYRNGRRYTTVHVNAHANQCTVPASPGAGFHAYAVRGIFEESRNSAASWAFAHGRSYKTKHEALEAEGLEA